MGYEVIVGDADGADSAIQRFLLENGATNATVFCTGDRPRNNLGDWPINGVTTYHAQGSRAYFTAKDITMADAARPRLLRTRRLPVLLIAGGAGVLTAQQCCRPSSATHQKSTVS